MTYLDRRTLATIPLVVTTLLAGTIGVVAQPDATIVIGDRLRPKHLVVEPGTVVTWRNDDDERHRVRSREGPAEFDSGNLEPGETYIHTFTVGGLYPYHDERNDEAGAYVGTIDVRAPEGPAATGGSAIAPALDVAVILFDEAFNPPAVTVGAGGTVEWRNEDGDDQHTVTSNDGLFNSGVMDGGTAFTQTFDTAGTFPYFCAIHAEMTGTVTVTGDADSSASPAQSTASPDPATSAAPEPVVGTAVSIVDVAFDPALIEVPVGATLGWTNDDPIDHTVTATDGTFDSGVVASGGTFSWTFETPGTFDYTCAIHTGMRGSVTVVEPVAATPTTGPP